MYGRFEYYGVADIEREMTEASLTEAATRFELVYQTGGTGGPYPSLDKAKQYAERLLKGGKDRWIAVIDAKQVNDLKRAKVLWLLKRDGGWEKGPRPLPNVPPTTQYNEGLGGLFEAVRKKTIRYWDRDVEYRVKGFSFRGGKMKMYAMKGKHGWVAVIPPKGKLPGEAASLPGGDGKTAEEAFKKTLELFRKQDPSAKFESVDWLDEARGTQTISMGQMMDLKRDPKAKQMAFRGAPGGPFAGFEVKTFPSREKMIEFLKKQAKKPTHGALGARDWKAVVKDKVAKNMVAYPSYQQESLFEAMRHQEVGPYSDPSAAHEKAMKLQQQGAKSIRVDKKKGGWVISFVSSKKLESIEGLGEASGAEKLWKELRSKKGKTRSTAVKGKPGKYKYKGKVGVWRTLDNGDKVFFPDDKSGPLAMRGPTRAKSKKPGLLKRIGGAIKRAFTREEIEAELERLEASSSPFPEVRERRVAELKAELEEAKKVPPGVLGRLGGDGRGRGLGRGRPGRGLGVGKPPGGRGLGPGKGKGPFRGTGEGPGTGTCENLRAQVDEAVAKGKHKPRKWLHIKPSMFKGGPGKGQQEAADAAGDLLTERKQALLTGAIRKKLPPIYSQDNEKDPMVHLKLFSPYMRMGYFLITEFDGDDTMFGAANTGQGWELGYMSLSEMEKAKGPGGVQAIERDMYFKPKKLSAAKADISRSRGEN